MRCPYIVWNGNPIQVNYLFKFHGIFQLFDLRIQNRIQKMIVRLRISIPVFPHGRIWDGVSRFSTA